MPPAAAGRPSLKSDDDGDDDDGDDGYYSGADPPPTVVLHRLECALRELAFNWSQSLLSHDDDGAAQKRDVAVSGNDIYSDLAVEAARCWTGIYVHWSESERRVRRAGVDALRLAADCQWNAPVRSASPPPVPKSRPTDAELSRAASRGGAPCVLHVATSGSDHAGTGSAAAPFASLARAQQALRAQRAASSSPSSTSSEGTRGGYQRAYPPCTVVVHGGTYYLGQTLELGPMDSNSEWVSAVG